MGKKETKVVVPVVEEIEEVVEVVEVRKPHYREFLESNVTVNYDVDPNDPRTRSDR